MSDEDTIHEFFRYGCQYYVAARYGVFASLIPVAGNLHHHAIEMLLKGALSKSMSLKEMKDKLGHKLQRSWEAFKTQAGDARLNRFDRAIQELAVQVLSRRNRRAGRGNFQSCEPQSGGVSQINDGTQRCTGLPTTRQHGL